ncbi:MAG TPA: RES domain-containing protein [Gemmataceae bacterium]|nr:RES domain-containing protein [Gemmataceae bacterium]
MTVRAYRVVKAKYAATAFDGEGARLYGGRWNSPGVRVVYVSESLSLSVLEILVHLQTNVLLSSYVTFAVELPETVIEELPTAALPADWREFPAPPAVRALGDAWVARGSSAALRVPSAVLAMEHNYLLNPAHAEFVRLAVSGPEPLDVDARVFRR